MHVFTSDLSRSLSYILSWWRYYTRRTRSEPSASVARLLPKRKLTFRRAFQPGYRRFRYLSVFIKGPHGWKTLSFVSSRETGPARRLDSSLFRRISHRANSDFTREGCSLGRAQFVEYPFIAGGTGILRGFGLFAFCWNLFRTREWVSEWVREREREREELVPWQSICRNRSIRRNFLVNCHKSN